MSHYQRIRRGLGAFDSESGEYVVTGIERPDYSGEGVGAPTTSPHVHKPAGLILPPGFTERIGDGDDQTPASYFAIGPNGALYLAEYPFATATPGSFKTPSGHWLTPYENARAYGMSQKSTLDKVAGMGPIILSAVVLGPIAGAHATATGAPTLLESFGNLFTDFVGTPETLADAANVADVGLEAAEGAFDYSFDGLEVLEETGGDIAFEAADVAEGAFDYSFDGLETVEETAGELGSEIFTEPAPVPDPGSVPSLPPAPGAPSPLEQVANAAKNLAKTALSKLLKPGASNAPPRSIVSAPRYADPGLSYGADPRYLTQTGNDGILWTVAGIGILGALILTSQGNRHAKR